MSFPKSFSSSNSRQNSRIFHSSTPSRTTSNDTAASSPQGHHIVGMYQNVQDSGEAEDYDSDADNQEIHSSVKNITRARQKSVSAIEQGLKHLASFRRDKFKKGNKNTPEKDMLDNGSANDISRIDVTEIFSKMNATSVNSVSTSTGSTNSISTNNTDSTISSYNESTPKTRERPKSLVWQDFSEFRDRIQQIKKTEETRRKTASPDVSPRAFDLIGKNSTNIQQTDIDNKANLSGSVSSLTSEFSQFASPNQRIRSTNVSRAEYRPLGPSPTSPSKTIVSYDSKSSLTSHDDEWDNHEPISSIQSIPRATPIRNSSLASPSSGSRQSSAERHLLNVFQQLKALRGQGIELVLFERVISDIMALYNQPGQDHQGIDRVCMSMADYIVQLNGGTVGMTSTPPYGNSVGLTSTPPYGTSWQSGGSIVRPQSAMYSTGGMYDSPSLGSNSSRRYQLRRYSRY